MGLAVVFAAALSLAGLVVWQLHGIALAASHLGAVAEACDHSGCDLDCSCCYALVNQPRGFVWLVHRRVQLVWLMTLTFGLCWLLSAAPGFAGLDPRLLLLAQPRDIHTVLRLGGVCPIGIASSCGCSRLQRRLDQKQQLLLVAVSSGAQ